MALQKNRIKDGITIVGAGTTGYLTTLYLCKNYPELKITWIYPEDNKPIGVGEATVPDVTHFLHDLGIDAKIILNKLNGSLKLGIRFEDFYEKGTVIYHPFGVSEEESFDLKYCMEHKIVPDDILDYEEIATHFDVRELMLYLDEVMKDLPNLTIDRRYVNSVEEIQEDFIVDCTGFSRSLYDYKFKSIADKVPNNRALVYRGQYTDKQKQKVPYTNCVGADYGWIWETPLNETIAFGYVHDDTYDVKDEFVKHLEKHFDTVDESLIRSVPMITGRNTEHMVQIGSKTVVAIGLSSFFIEPLESTGLYLVAYGVKTLNSYLQGEFTMEEYNTVYNKEFDVILDFIVAHYKFSKRDNEYWNRYKDIDIELYKENNIFPKRSWDYLLSGFNQVEYKPKMNPITHIKVRKGKPFYDKVF
jgi:tryptophan halogenase